MSIKQTIFTYLATTPIFFAIDLIWLGLIARNMYQKYIGHLMADKVNWVSAIFFYLAYILGIIIFAVNPANKENSWTKALLLGSLFGFFTYATYDLTNLATLKNWPLTMTIIDIIWGIFITSLTAVAAFYISKFF
ncbi:DUF2177 family protein [Candidatus Dojkabacteria bacterium]|nr:DUF2177 family protein [Candidatus Dojkabacteria bacterium]